MKFEKARGRTLEELLADDPTERVLVHVDKHWVAIRDDGLVVVLFFKDSFEGDLKEIRIIPEGDAFDPFSLIPRLPLYVLEARATAAFKLGDADAAFQGRRRLGATRRGLDDDFYRAVALVYNALIAEGVRHPVKTLAKQRFVTISTASRWIKGARDRGFIKEDNNG